MTAAATPGVVIGAAEIALNRYLRLEPEVLAECGRLAGRSIELHLQHLDWRLRLEPDATGVRVLDGAAAQGEADVGISGSPVALLRHVFRMAEGETGLPQGLKVQGDADVLYRFNRLLARVGFDPEELLAKLVGDAAAPRVVQALQDLFGWGRKAAATLSLDTAEYLREETGDLVHRADVEKWMDGVERLRDRTERLEARLNRLP